MSSMFGSEDDKDVLEATVEKSYKEVDKSIRKTVEKWKLSMTAISQG